MTKLYPSDAAYILI